MAIQLARNNILFQELTSPVLSIAFNGKKKTHYDMELVMDQKIFLNTIEPDQDIDDS